MKAIFKIFMMLAAVAFMAACNDDVTGLGTGLGINAKGVVVTFDKSVIQASGNDVVTFRAYNDGNEVTDQAKFYIQKNGKWENFGGSFSTDQVGVYTFKAAYKTGQSEYAYVNAVSMNIPAAANDPQPKSTSFVHRTFFNQHTGAECVWCPYMTHLLHKTLTEGYEDKVVLVAVRSDESGFANVTNPSGVLPYLHIDYSSDYDHQMATDVAVERLRAKIDGIVSTPAKVGMSAVAQYYDDGQIIVKVSVKAAVTDEYNVGLWMLQDNFYTPQDFKNANDPSALDGTWVPGSPQNNPYSYHDNCLRLTESRYLGAHVGYPLGRIEAGKTADWIFLVKAQIGNEDVNGDGEVNLNDSWWKGKSKVNLDDLHFAAFVTTHKGNTYTVVNAIDFPYNGSVAFEYE